MHTYLMTSFEPARTTPVLAIPMKRIGERVRREAGEDRAESDGESWLSLN
jgi:hypothetical protein